MRKDRDYRSFASLLLQIATVTPVSPIAKNDALRPPAKGDQHKVLVGTIVDCDPTLFLADESSPHAYILTDARRAKAFTGRKVRVMGALKSPHVLAVETIDDL